MAVGTVTRLCSCHHCLVLVYFQHPKRKSLLSQAATPSLLSSLPQPPICLPGWLWWTVQLSGITCNWDLPYVACHSGHVFKVTSYVCVSFFFMSKSYPLEGQATEWPLPPLLIQVRPQSMACPRCSESTCGMQGWQRRMGLPP